MTAAELDVRGLRKPDRHPAVFSAYDALEAGGHLDLVNSHDPRHLREEFEVEHPGSYGWEYLDSGPDVWRIRITKLASTPLPRLLCDTTRVVAAAEPAAAGALWKLPMRTRDLDSNLVQLPADTTVDGHRGPDVDVLVHVVRGSGELVTELGSVALHAGSLLWLPRRSWRAFSAGPLGLQYLTVHQRRPGLTLLTAP